MIANGQIVGGAMDAEVLSNNYYSADRFNASVALGLDPASTAAFWSNETDLLVELQFSLDGGASFTSLIQGAVDCVTMDPTLGLAHLTGRDLTARLIETRTQETFANRTSSEIATLLAGRHGLTPQVTATSTPVGRYYQSEHDSVTLDQFSHATTEWDLLVLLARWEGFDVFVAGTTLCFQPAANPADATFSFCPSDVVDIKLERSLILAGGLSVVVKSWNSRQNSAFVQQAQGRTANSAGPTQNYIYVRPNLTPDAALKLANQKLTELTRHERTIEVRMPGELMLNARSIISLEGTGTDFDQAYYVDLIERRINYGTGMTQFIRAKNTSAGTATGVGGT
jgi:hypothetical protein